MDQRQILYARWQALNSAIQIHKAWLEDLLKAQPNDKRLEILHCLLSHLEEFAKGQFNFFYEGFRTDVTVSSLGKFAASGQGFSTNAKMVESGEFPPDHVLKTILDQISDDLDVIRRAAADEVVANTGNVTANALRTGDCLVRDALKPADQKLGIKNPIPLTYFQKSAAIRVIPYDSDSTVLIGLPFTSIQVPRDFLAIPHEAGHFVFWNGKTNNQPVWKAIQGLIDASDVSQWIKPWTEEIFADVYGCLVAGPVIALSFQDLQMLESFDKFITDDGVHPTPLVRPHVYSETLKLMGKSACADALNVRWQTNLEDWPHPEKTYNTLANQGHILLHQSSMVQTGISSSAFAYIRGYFQVSLDVAKQEITKVVKIIHTFLSESFFDDVTTPTNWWQTISDLYSNNCQTFLENDDDIYTPFDEYVNNRDNQFCDELTGILTSWTCNSEFIWSEWVANQKLSQQIQGKVEISTVISEDDWKTIWIADGWATRGPMANWP